MIRPINFLQQITLQLLIPTGVPVLVMNQFRKGLFACPTCLWSCRGKDKWIIAWITHWYKPNLDQPLPSNSPDYMQSRLLQILAQKLVKKSGFPFLLSWVWGWEPSSSCLRHSSFCCPQAMPGGEQDGCTQWETRIGITHPQGTRSLIMLLQWTELAAPHHAPEKISADLCPASKVQHLISAGKLCVLWDKLWFDFARNSAKILTAE